jgi:hypothetical protein
LRIFEPNQLTPLTGPPHLKSIDIRTHRRKVVSHRDVLIDGSSELYSDQQDDEDAYRDRDEAAGETKQKPRR